MTTLTLFTKPECPFCWKVRLAFSLNQLDYEGILVDTRDKPQALLDISPKGTVPVLVTDGEVIDESALIIEFLEARPAGVRLLDDPRSQALEQYSDTVVGAKIRDAIFMRRDQPEEAWDQAVLQACQNEWTAILQTLEAQCDAVGPWFLGASPSVADCALAARFALASFYQLTGLEQHPKLHQWFSRLLHSDTFKTASPDYLTRALRGQLNVNSARRST